MSAEHDSARVGVCKRAVPQEITKALASSGICCCCICLFQVQARDVVDGGGQAKLQDAPCAVRLVGYVM